MSHSHTVPTEQFGLLHSKLLPPRLQEPLVQRERLLQMLDAGLRRKLTLVTAPAGFGKSTLVRQWLEGVYQGTGIQSAWLSLDEGDNDPMRYWRYVIAACQTVESHVGRAALAQIRDADGDLFAAPSFEGALGLLLNDAARLGQQMVLVLEDYHLIRSPTIHDGMAFLLDHLPPAFHLILISRSEPPLPLARLRARCELQEIKTADLRFTRREVEQFTAQVLPIELDAATIKRVRERTEGWPVGLRLAALSLRELSDATLAAEALESFSGRQRPVSEFLVSDVLDAVPEPVRAFLLQSVFLERLNGSLCGAVTGRHDAPELLARVEQANLFLVPLQSGGDWYRYHALFAEAMREEARRRFGDTVVREWLGRASRWYEQQDMLPDAVESALVAREWIRAGELIERIVQAQEALEVRERHTLRRWLDQLPESVLKSHPLLCHLYALVLAVTTRRPLAPIADRLEELAGYAEAGWRNAGQLARLGELLAARALISLWLGRLADAVEFSRQAIALLPAEEVRWRGVALGFVGHAEVRAGQFNAALPILQEARALHEASASGPGARASSLKLAMILTVQGETQQGARLYHHVLASATADEDPSDEGPALLGLAQIAYEWDDLQEAERRAEAGMAVASASGYDEVQVEADLLLARVEQARGDVLLAQSRLSALLASSTPHRLGHLHREVLACQARLRLAAGNTDAALTWTDNWTPDSSLPARLHDEEALLAARLKGAQGDFAGSVALLTDCRISAKRGGRLRTVMQAEVLRALVEAATGNVKVGAQILSRQLGAARVAGYRRLFLDEGEALSELLRATIPALRDVPARTFGQELLQASMRYRDPDASRELLSQQERRVLYLLAEDRSKPEIARELVVSVNTIKSQVRHIYRRLGASSRKEAVLIARELELL